MDNWRDIRQRARETRALLGPRYADAPASAVLDALVRQWDIAVDDVAPDHPLLRGARAAWREDYGLALVDRTLSPPERAFAVAHELGHRVCHPGGHACEPDDIDDATLPVALPLGEGRVWGYNPRQAREVEANIFAAELLAPAAGLRAHFLAGLDYRILADRYGVTPTCALNGLVGAVLGGYGERPSPPPHADWSLGPTRGPTAQPALPDAGEGSLPPCDRNTVSPVIAPSVIRGAGIDMEASNVVDGSPSPAVRERGKGGEGPLDASQRRVAETDAGRVLVDAGPGTGKTRTLVARVLSLLRGGVDASEILVLTFSNRAAGELRERLRAEGRRTAGVTVGTFHGYALDALRRFAPQAGLPDGFRVVDDVDAAIMLEQALPALRLERYTHLARPTLYFPALLQAASRMRDLLLTPDDLAAQAQTTAVQREEAEHEAGSLSRITADIVGVGETPALAVAASPSVDNADGDEQAALDETLRLLAAYDELLAARGLVDYGGLIARAVALLQSDPVLARVVRGGLRHVLVDEYQDVNRASAVLLRALVAGGADLWVVGDVRQSIYRFRGAEPRNIALFEQDFPDAVRLSLDRNYRATPALVDTIAAVAARLTGVAAPWVARRARAADEEALVAVAPDEVSERAGIAADITRSIAAGHRPEDHAVLCRTHRQAADVAAALEKAGLPTTYLGALFLRPEIKDLLALLEFCRGLDGSALLRLSMWPEYHLDGGRAIALIGAARERGVPFPAALGDAGVTSISTGEERAVVARLHAHVEAVRYYPDPAAVLLHYLFGEGPYLRRLLRDDGPRARQAAAAIFQLVVLARGFMARPLSAPGDDATHAFLRYLRRLLADGETTVAPATAAAPGAVNVLTVHGSKGLEFPVVYVPNLAHGRFPPRAHGGVRIALPPALERDPRADAAEERNLFFVAVSRARDRLVLSRAARYGGRALGESELLAMARGARAVRDVAWPGVAVAAAPDPATSPVGLAAVAMSRDVATARDVETVMRCPSLHDYRQAGLRGDDGPHGYRLFARLLREGLARLRSAHGTAAWPGSSDEAARQFAAWAEDRWPADGALGAWYGAAAERAVRRVYEELREGGIAPTTRYRQEYAIDLDGHTVSVTLDAVEDIDGVPHAILERATRRNDDTQGIAVALYAAAGRVMSPAAPAPVLIRYLDSGDTRAVPDPARVLAKHASRLGQALDQLARDDYPSAPYDDGECARCPLVFVCPR